MARSLRARHRVTKNPVVGHFSKPRASIAGLLILAVTAGYGLGDTISWADHQGELGDKPFDDGPASYQLVMDSNTLSFKLVHQGASSGMFSYSQWIIERWPGIGDPVVKTEYNTASNANNDVAFSMFGYYGEDGAGPRTLPTDGDFDSYSLSISFDQPVTDLSFDVNSINALIKNNGFNSQDILTIRGSLNGEFVSIPSFLPASEGDQAYVIAGDTLTGDFDHGLVLNAPDPGHHVTDSGTVGVTFTSVVDTIEIIMKSVATTVPPNEFQPGYVQTNGGVVQTWLFSVGDLTFTTVPEPSRGILGLLGGLLLLKRRR